MNWNAPIGFGKAGNNPYTMAGVGTGLVDQLLSMGGTGGTGRGGGAEIGTDPTTQAFVTESMAAGQPLSQIPRQYGVTNGLIPMLLAKAGLIAPTVSATPLQHSIEELKLQELRQNRLSDMLNNVAAVAKIGSVSPAAASQAAAAMPSANVPAGMDVSKWTYPEQEKIRADQAREANEQARLKIQDKNAQTALAREQAYEERVLGQNAAELQRANKQSRNEESQMYFHEISRAQTNAHNVLGNPDAITQYQHYANYLADSLSKGVPFYEAMANARIQYPLASETESPPPQPGTDYLGAAGRLLGGLIPSALRGASPSASAAGGTTTPTIVKPKFTK